VSRASWRHVDTRGGATYHAVDSEEQPMSSGLKGFVGAWLLWVIAIVLANASVWSALVEWFAR
jgi:hypothetical protein